MTQHFNAMAFRAFATADLSAADRGLPGHIDPARPGSRSPLDWLDDHGGRPTRLDLLNGSSLALASTSDRTAPDAGDGGFVMRCGCAGCLEAAARAEALADKQAAATAANEAWKAENPGGEFLLDDIKDGPTDPGPGTYHVLDAQEGDSVHSQIDAPLDQDWFLVELSGGQSYKFILTPDNQTGDPVVSPDLLITIYDSAGNAIGSVYDSGSWGATEEASFTPTADGTYYVAVSGWTPADIGGYTLTAEINNEGGPTGGTPLAAINWGGDDNIVDTDGVTTPQGQAVIHVYFSQTGDAPYGSADDPVVGVSWEQYQKDAAFAAFGCYENIINVKFVEVATPEEADFIMAATASAPVILGRMRPPNEPNEGLGEFNILASSWSEEGLAQGGFGFITLIHELGHAMGLAHPHDTGGGSEVMHGVTGDLATGYSYGDFDLNQGVFTTMSYNDGWDTAPHGGSDGGDAYGYQGTLMALDVAMLQIKYGANTTYNSTDTIYALPTVNQAGTFYACIWDTGGTDWIIAGAGIDCVIDLRPATLEYEYGGGGFVSYAAGIHGGFTIAAGAVIENAIGGAGDDTLTGNDAANWLMGGLASDALSGGGGDDRLAGEDGDDTLDGGDGFDFADYTDAAAGVTVNLGLAAAQNTGGGGLDTLSNIEALWGSDHNDSLTGNGSANTLNGAGGNDTLIGGGGVDALNGGDGNDGLNGGAGADTTDGGLGNDSHWIDDAGDVVIEAAGQGTDRVFAGLSYTLAAGVEVETLSTTSDAGTAAIDLTGNEFSNTVVGNAGANALSGGAGADSLLGNAGDDALRGGADADIFAGGAGADTYLFAAGDGHDIVNDWVAGEDSIEVTGFDDYILIQEGAHLRIVFDASNSILLRNTTQAAFQAGDINISEAGANVITGTGGNDALTGTAGVDEIDGLGGNDTLLGLGGDDSLVGGLGNDVLNGGAGVDQTDGGGGNDNHWVDDAADVVIEDAGEGTDRVIASVNYVLGAGVSVEVLQTISENATTAIDLTGNELNNTVVGNAGANVLDGGDGADSLLGGGGGDDLVGGLGNDVLNGGAGADDMAGGAGSDSFYVHDAGDTVVETVGEGNDRVFASVDYALSAGAEVETLSTSSDAGTAAIDLTGNEFGQKLVGNNGDNTLDGGAGADSLLGNGGDDILIGGSGNDQMRGGGGTDEFLFNAGLFGNDTILDFADGSEAIRFDGIAGVDDFSDLTVTANGAGWAVITLPDGSRITLTGVGTGQVDATDFLFGP